MIAEEFAKEIASSFFFLFFFHTTRALQEIASRSLDEKTVFKSQKLQFEGYPFPRPISCHSART